jgi:hypothetical protein
LEASASLIVSGDHHLLELEEYEGSTSFLRPSSLHASRNVCL